MTRTFAVAGGGTGGHVTMALALCEEIEARGDGVFVLGSERGMEKELVPEAGFELVTLDARQFMGQRVLAAAMALVALIGATFAAWRVLRKRHVVLVVSVGGYAAMPAVIAAGLGGIPSVLVEPNVIPGRGNRLMARFARRIFTGFDGTESHFAAAAGQGRVRKVGMPVRRALIDAVSRESERRVDGPPFHLLVAGGSQGARQLNDGMIEALADLDVERFEFFHQTGTADAERVRAAYAAAGARAEVVDFEKDMPARYAWADLVLCRAGALTVAELELAGLPSLLVPYPYAADDHQAANAKELEAAGAGRVLDAHDLDGKKIAQALDAAFAAPDALAEMSRAARGLARPDAAREVVTACLEIAGTRGADAAKGERQG